MKQFHKNPLHLILLILSPIMISLACTLPSFNTQSADVVSTMVCPTCEVCVECGNENVVVTEATLTEEPQPLPTNTATAAATVKPTELPQPTNTPVNYPYQIQPGTPSYIPNIHHTDLGDQWLGVGGQVFGSDGLPEEYIVVRVQGSLDGKNVDITSMTGVADQFGPGGYEIQLANHGIDSTDSLTITLYNLQGEPISENIAFDTHNNSEALQIIINFINR